MEKLTIYFVFFIAAFLLYSFIKLKIQNKKSKELEKNKIKKQDKKESFEEYVVAAVVATLMDGKKYKIRNIFLEKKEKKTSTWKTAGIQKNMQRTDTYF